MLSIYFIKLGTESNYFRIAPLIKLFITDLILLLFGIGEPESLKLGSHFHLNTLQFEEVLSYFMIRLTFDCN